MRKSLDIAAVFSFALALGACSSAPPVAIPPDWGYQKDAISLHIKADPQLNLFQRNSHALLLCVFHLKDPSSFNQLQAEKDGLRKLLECDRFDQSVVHAKRIMVQPGEEINETMDRADGARFVNVAAGYYHIRKNRFTRSFAVEVSQEKLGASLVQKPRKLVIDLYLGPEEIRHEPATAKAPEKEEAVGAAGRVKADTTRANKVLR